MGFTDESDKQYKELVGGAKFLRNLNDLFSVFFPGVLYYRFEADTSLNHDLSNGNMNFHSEKIMVNSKAIIYS